MSFTETRREAIEELSCALVMLEHPSGARVVHLAYDDPEMLFALAFRTVPTRSDGVAHILEHSVLCGSKKYPVKEPFIELIKGSLQTFLNAMTFPDKTMYPLASRNHKDFKNLMSVYLDAVFYPHITEETFMQEEIGRAHV